MMTILLFLLVLTAATALLLLFGVYRRRKTFSSVEPPPAGAGGSLKERDLPRLTAFLPRREPGDSMSQGLNKEGTGVEQGSHIDPLHCSELERMLLDRTRHFAALDAVALTLSQAGSLKDMLDKSLTKIFDSIDGLERRGGIFLCDPDGETLRLTARQGLSPEFVRDEETILMSECLCGKVARTGEILYSQDSCADPDHTRRHTNGSHSHIIFPVRSRGIVLGVVFLYPDRDFVLKPTDLQLLEIIGSQLGLAIENFRFYAEEKELSEKYWDLFENARDILFTVDPTGRLTAVNKAFEAFSGFSKIELIGKNVRDFLTQGSAQDVSQLLSDTISPRIIEFEVVKRDGSHAFVEVISRKLFKSLVPAGFQISARDMTEQKNLREMLVKAERLGAIGQIGVAVRHEINNPLTTIIGNVELLLERYQEKDKDISARLEVILNNALRITEIINRVEKMKQEKVIEYLHGVKMTDLNKE